MVTRDWPLGIAVICAVLSAPGAVAHAQDALEWTDYADPSGRIALRVPAAYQVRIMPGGMIVVSEDETQNVATCVAVVPCGPRANGPSVRGVRGQQPGRPEPWWRGRTAAARGSASRPRVFLTGIGLDSRVTCLA